MSYSELRTKDAKGKERFWIIELSDLSITTYWGMVGGHTQKSEKKLCDAKKAKTEADKLYRTKLNHGYIEYNTSVDSSDVDESDSSIETLTPKSLLYDNFLPMLANKYQDHKSKVTFPCYVQPKLDGVRCVGRYNINDNTIILKSRNNIEFLFFDKIKQDVIKLIQEIQNKTKYPIENIYIDGEIYNKNLKFQDLNGYCNTTLESSFNSIPEDHIRNIKYNIFDIYLKDNPDMTFENRYKMLKSAYKECEHDYLTLVETIKVDSHDKIDEELERYILDSYEGIIIRNINGKYKIKSRTFDLLKYKKFFDNEYEVVNAITSDSGKEEGCIIFVLKDPNSNPDLSSKSSTFKCRPSDTYEARKEMWEDYKKNPTKYIGKKYTIRYQETYPNGKPRFPVGVGFRCDMN